MGDDEATAIDLLADLMGARIVSCPLIVALVPDTKCSGISSQVSPVSHALLHKMRRQIFRRLSHFAIVRYISRAFGR